MWFLMEFLKEEEKALLWLVKGGEAKVSQADQWQPGGGGKDSALWAGS